mmetsp:Transcript_69568/g.155068  ORF Transcript_69568/g.155068 Transcript_69568/m.155068 type:complete len:299 (-) Transcript_69568:530-1426(-)
MSQDPVWLQLALPAAAGGAAVCFSHPLELTKVRLQLDNERAARDIPRQYRGWLDCVAQNWRSEGVRGLQRGLGLGIIRETCFNAVRIGLYVPLMGLVASRGGERRDPTPSERFGVGLACGALGGGCINPVEVLKTRMQAQGGLTGHQHKYTSIGEALRSLLRDEGLVGCFKGVGVSTLRGVLGPGSQLISYNELKTIAITRGADGNATSTHIVCALASAAVSVACVNPVDVVRTRLYNQPASGEWYTGAGDVAAQLVRKEGALAFYKGAMTHYLRLGPHMVLVFSFLEQLKILRERYR